MSAETPICPNASLGGRIWQLPVELQGAGKPLYELSEAERAARAVSDKIQEAFQPQLAAMRTRLPPAPASWSPRSPNPQCAARWKSENVIGSSALTHHFNLTYLRRADVPDAINGLQITFCGPISIPERSPTLSMRIADDKLAWLNLHLPRTGGPHGTREHYRILNSVTKPNNPLPHVLGMMRLLDRATQEAAVTASFAGTPALLTEATAHVDGNFLGCDMPFIFNGSADDPRFTMRRYADHEQPNPPSISLDQFLLVSNAMLQLIPDMRAPNP